MFPFLALGYSSSTRFKFSAQAVIFDWDDTLTNSASFPTPSLTPDDSPSTSSPSSNSSNSSVPPHRSYFDIDREGKFLKHAPHSGQAKSYYEAEAFKAEATRTVHFPPGAMALAESLCKGDEKRFAIVSPESNPAVDDMEHAGIPRSEIIGDNTPTLTSAAEVARIIHAVKQTSFPLSECVVVTNSPTRIRAAVASGASRVIAVCSSYDRADLRKHRPHYVVDSLEAVQCSSSDDSEGLEFYVWVPGNPLAFPHIALTSTDGSWIIS
ncbi:hypothetical protein D9758_005862 [Tetrapyrgos nigripes]|uniref:Uncharacterized protein n=1 Tax=Tetrapyrgos nigripes TaxID=182062 RepID=A0A8H5G2W7_9AGAR|nr:hypothetical protein D9758_005862 [Tetrapyrgos nigripes]